MSLTKDEKALVNSYQIKEEFNQKSKSYRCPFSKSKGIHCANRGKSGKVKIYNESEIFLYKLGLVKGMTEIDI